MNAAPKALPGVDHAIIGVRNLDVARQDWQRLGFTVTPRGRHREWGTGNFCVMFPEDYVELLGILDPTRYVHGLDGFLARREGLLGLAFALGDVEAAKAAFREAGLGANGPTTLSRLLELPEGSVEPSFRLLQARDTRPLGISAFACEHLTPDLVRQPSWLDHPNTARGIRAFTIAVADPEALIPVYESLFGLDALYFDGGGLTVRVGEVSLHFGAAEPAPRGESAGELDGMLGLAIEVGDIAIAGRLLFEAGVRFRHTGDGLDIAPQDASGVALSLVAGK